MARWCKEGSTLEERRLGPGNRKSRRLSSSEVEGSSPDRAPDLCTEN